MLVNKNIDRWSRNSFRKRLAPNGDFSVGYVDSVGHLENGWNYLTIGIEDLFEWDQVAYSKEAEIAGIRAIVIMIQSGRIITVPVPCNWGLL